MPTAETTNPSGSTMQATTSGKGTTKTMTQTTKTTSRKPTTTAATVSDEPADNRWDADSHTVTNIVATDALGRTFPVVNGFKEDRYVGLFYFMWLGNQGEVQEKVYNIEEMLKSNPSALWDPSGPDESPNNVPYFFAEPLYGYYNNADPWVVRKHIELFIAAGIDFLAIDVTNSLVYPNVWPVLLELLHEYRQAGWDAPQVVFFTKTNQSSTVDYLYYNIYKDELYPDTWFKGPYDKPLIIADINEISDPEIRNFFHFRPPQWPNEPYQTNGFPYVDWTYPQPLYNDLMGVSVAQHVAGAFSWSAKPGRLNRGRGFSYSANTNVTEDIAKGTNFQSQWDNVIKADPQITFVTGWNEWVALKLIPEWEPDTPMWVDTFNVEYSRDAEMMKGGYGDNFYLQIGQNLRRYKGIAGQSPNPVSQKIDVYGAPSQWNTVSNVYLNIATDKIERAYTGFLPTIVYTQKKPNNFIRQVRVTHDADNVYFYVQTDKPITDPGNATNWMNLFIGVDGSKDPSWESFQYVVNRYPGSKKTSLEKSTGGFRFTRKDDVDYSVRGTVMQIKIPKSALGITGNTFSLTFKLADSIEKPSDIMDYYVSGESMPLGRLAYSYTVK